MSSRLLIAPLALGLLTGCNTVNPQTGSVDPGFGEAIKYDMAAQTIDPDPVYAADSAQPGDNGEHAAGAVKRYRTGTVKEVQIMNTTSGGSGGSSGGGSGPQ